MSQTTNKGKQTKVPSTNRSEVLLKYAKRYIELGFAIHPCCPVDHRCASPGKVPYDPVEQIHKAGWQNHEIPTVAEVQEWIDQDSSINLGFLCGGPSRIICIDIDTPEAWQIYQEEFKPETTWEFATGNGVRFMYAMPLDMESFSSLNIDVEGGFRIEILGDGKQTVAPPSEHPNGKLYRWKEGLSPESIDIAPAPSWLVELRPMSSTDEEIDWSVDAAEGILAGGRNVGIARLAGHLLAPQPLPPKEVLFWLRIYNSTKVRPPLSDRELQGIIKSIAKREMRSGGFRNPEEKAEIKRLMLDHHLSWSDAEIMWKGMG